MPCKTGGCNKRRQLNDAGYCADCVKRQEKKKITKEAEKCLKCDIEFKNDEKECCIQCEICEGWVHSICIDITREVYDVLYKKGGSSLSGFKWFCGECDKKIVEVIDKMASIETKTKCLEKDMEIVKEKIEKIEKSIKTRVKDQVADVIDDREEVEWRKYNLIVFGLPESPSEETDDRIDEDTWKMEDIKKTDLNVSLSPRNGIYDARRLGKLDKNKTRPLRITFDDIRTKRDVLINAKKLKKCSEPYKKQMFINPDLTAKQREEDEQLRKKMWERREKFNENVIIRKGKIVTAPFEVRKIRNQKPGQNKDINNLEAKKSNEQSTSNDSD